MGCLRKPPAEVGVAYGRHRPNPLREAGLGGRGPDSGRASELPKLRSKRRADNDAPRGLLHRYAQLCDETRRWRGQKDRTARLSHQAGLPAVAPDTEPHER